MDALSSLATMAKATEKAEGFLKEILGPPAKELGELWKDKISARRFRNLTKIVSNAKDQLETAGISPTEVPLKIIHPGGGGGPTGTMGEPARKCSRRYCSHRSIFPLYFFPS